MSMAWCILWGTRAAFSDVYILNHLHEGVTTMMGRILMSITLTLAVVCCIFILDPIDDNLNTGEDGSAGTEVVATIIEAMGVLVGFSWEHSFDGGVEAIASVSPHKKLVATALTIFVFCAIVPAWRSYILTKAMQLEGYKNEGERDEYGVSSRDTGGETEVQMLIP
mmetsp:Transcript_36898/g.64995  ORF Transcript_36898/g.64995 Transcript_36898/m.64995 type:complete len:166 (-) Transcript_36898:25-522(-)